MKHYAIRQSNDIKASWLAGYQKYGTMPVCCIWSNNQRNAKIFDDLMYARSICAAYGNGAVVVELGFPAGELS